MTHFASFTAAAQLHFGIVTDAGAISMNAAFPQFSSLQDVVVAGALKDLAKAAVGREIDFKLYAVFLAALAACANIIVFNIFLNIF